MIYSVLDRIVINDIVSNIDSVKNTTKIRSYATEEIVRYRVDLMSPECELTEFRFDILTNPIMHPDEVAVDCNIYKTDSEGHYLSGHDDYKYVDRNDFYNMNEDELYNFLKSKVKIDLFQ